MKRSKKIILVLITITFSVTGFCQTTQKEFSTLLQTYFLTKDTAIVTKSISFLNDPSADIREIQPILIGFYGALFSADQKLKSSFAKNISNIKQPAYQQFFTYLLSTNIDTIYARSFPSTEKNDMNWSSFFATGNTKFLDNIIGMLTYSDDLSDMKLFMTGQSAKWSLCSNARQYEKVKSYLVGIKGSNKIVDELLLMDPEKIQDDAVKILKAQKAKGVW